MPVLFVVATASEERVVIRARTRAAVSTMAHNPRSCSIPFYTRKRVARARLMHDLLVPMFATAATKLVG